MKILVTIIVVLAVALTTNAFALNPSIQVGDLTMVAIATPEGVTLSPDFVVETSNETDFSLWLFESISEYLDDTDMNHTIDYFPPDVTIKINAMLPMGTDLDSLHVTEFLPVSTQNYKQDYGDIDLIFGFPTVYDADDTVIAVLAYKPDDITEYIPLYTDVREDGSIEVAFTVEAMQAVMEHDAAMMVLRAE